MVRNTLRRGILKYLAFSASERPAGDEVWATLQQPLRVVNLRVHPSPPSLFLHLQKLRSLLIKLLLHLCNSVVLQSLAPGQNFAARNRTRIHRGKRRLEARSPFLKSLYRSLLRQNLSPPLLHDLRVRWACGSYFACSAFCRRAILRPVRCADFRRSLPIFREVRIRDHFLRCSCCRLGPLLTILARNIPKRLPESRHARQKKERRDRNSKLADVAAGNSEHNSP